MNLNKLRLKIISSQDSNTENRTRLATRTTRLGARIFTKSASNERLIHSNELALTMSNCQNTRNEADEPTVYIGNNYESFRNKLEKCFSLGLISVDLERDDSGLDVNLEDKDTLLRNNQLLRKQVKALQTQLSRSQDEKEIILQEKAAQKRDLTNLKKSLRLNGTVRAYEAKLSELKGKIDFLEVERDYFVRELQKLNDKVDELEKINDAKTCKLNVFENLFQMIEVNKQTRTDFEQLLPDGIALADDALHNLGFHEERKDVTV